MKKIMFNEDLGLMEAALDGRKTQTRRRKANYKVGEVVAIAQRYEDVLLESPDRYTEEQKQAMRAHMGYWNKMNVKADLMVHHIRITGMRQENIQDISAEDCIREGIYVHTPNLDDPIDNIRFTAFSYNCHKGGDIPRWWFNTPQEAYMALIKKMYKGMWENNTTVYVYDFKLID